MLTKARDTLKKHAKALYIAGVFVLVLVAAGTVFGSRKSFSSQADTVAPQEAVKSDTTAAPAQPTIPPLDTALYDKLMLALANNPAPKVATSTPTATVGTTSGTGVATGTPQTKPTVPAKPPLWPPKTVYPNPGALLPFNRIVAYYGNFYSKGMGVLGQYPSDVALQKLQAEVAKWQAADPSTPVIPAIHYIVTTAQGSPGKDGKYRLRMPDSQVDHALDMAHKIHGIVFIDIQVGLSNIQSELPIYEKYLKMSDVHLGIDPEFAMATSGKKPGTVIGTMSAADINYAANYLAKIVRDNNLPPKILVVHRFTKEMVTNAKAITPLPEVQIVMDMDGWGFGSKKINTYKTVIYPEPVQFTGFKLFYKNDLLPPSKGMLTPAQVLSLSPKPIYIQYQ